MVPFLHHRTIDQEDQENYKFYTIAVDKSGEQLRNERWYFRPDNTEKTTMGLLQMDENSYSVVFDPVQTVGIKGHKYSTLSKVTISLLGYEFPEPILISQEPGKVRLEISIDTSYYMSMSTHGRIVKQTLEVDRFGWDPHLTELMSHLAKIE
jgi:hypothetical protein